MTAINRVLVLALVAMFTTVNAQDFQGVATYKTMRSVDIKMDSTSNPGISQDMHKQMAEMLKKQFQKTFTLTFDKESSVYKEDENLEAPQVGGSDVMIKVVGAGGGSDILYKNTKDNRYADKKDTMGKIFLVKDELEPIEWQLEKETKFIGEYRCFKASYIKMVPKPQDFKSISKALEEDKEPEMIERVVTAWYTPQIPVNNGPAMYQGLPGLILEVHDGKLNIICSKIVLNPGNKVDIKEPTKGKEVNQEKYDEIMEEKRKEMLERYAPRKGRRNGNTYSISIGG